MYLKAESFASVITRRQSYLHLNYRLSAMGLPLAGFPESYRQLVSYFLFKTSHLIHPMPIISTCLFCLFFFSQGKIQVEVIALINLKKRRQSWANKNKRMYVLLLFHYKVYPTLLFSFSFSSSHPATYTPIPLYPYTPIPHIYPYCQTVQRAQAKDNHKSVSATTLNIANWVISSPWKPR